MPVAAFVALAGVGSSMISADAASNAAEEQADALRQSEETLKAAAEQAREDVNGIMEPAMTSYMNRMGEVEQSIISGERGIFDIMQEATGRADQILSQGGLDAQKMILGAQATARGIPREQFETSYQAGQVPGQTAPPAPVGVPGAEGAPTPTGVPTTLGGAAGAPIGMANPFAPGGPLEGQTPGQVAPGMPSPETTQVGGGPGVGFAQATADLAGARDISRAGIEAGRAGALGQLAMGRQDFAGAEERGLGRTAAYSQFGQQAAQQEAALSGALGPEAQQAAQDAFMESPGQAFLRKRQEEALLRSAGATGGLGGGRVLTALQEQAMGIAATQQQQQMANLGTIAGRGAQVGMGEQGFIGQMGAGRAGLAQAGAGVETQMAAQMAQIESIYGPQMAQYAMQTGLQLADLQKMTSEQRAQLQTQLGGGLAGVRGGTLGDVARLGQTAAQTGLQSEQSRAELLANIGVRSGSQIADVQGQIGAAQAAGTMAAGQAIGQGIAGVGTAVGYGGGLYGTPDLGQVANQPYQLPPRTPTMTNDFFSSR